MMCPCDNCQRKTSETDRCNLACDKLIGYNIREHLKKTGILIKEGIGKKKKKRRKNEGIKHQ